MRKQNESYRPRLTTHATDVCMEPLESRLLLAADIIVDNLSPDFAKTGTWNESAAIDEYAGSSVTATAIGAKATWRPTLSQAGTYDVYAWWSAKKADGTRYDRDSQAGYVIHYSGGTATRTVDQDLNSGKWVRLGTFTFAAGTSGYVDLVRDTANGVSTCADAVRFVAASTARAWYVDDVTDPHEDGSAAHPFDVIQEAVDLAQAGDQVVINPGLYRQTFIFKGVDITVRSTNPNDPKVVASTIVGDREYFVSRYGISQLPNVVTLTGTESAACTLTGLTIAGGFYGIWSNEHFLATIKGNVIQGNGRAVQDPDPPYATFWSGGGIAKCDGDILNNDISRNIGRGLTECNGHIQRNTITNNVQAATGRTSQYPGGGLYNCDGLIEDNVISHNMGGYYGGGVSHCDGTIRRNAITFNRAVNATPSTINGYGGGLYHCDGTIESNLIYGNIAADGGGMYDCIATVRNCTFAANEATVDGGDGQGQDVYALNGGTFTNSIFAGTVAGDGRYSYCDAIGSGGSGAGWDPAYGIDGGGNIDAYPMFLNGAEPGGADGKYFTADDGLQLLPGSRCIDAGNGSVAPTTDILGKARKDDAGMPNTGTGTPKYTDIGAYEFQRTSPLSEIIVDNLGAGFSKTGTWNESAAIDEYAGSSVTATAIGAKATWRPTLPTAGQYEVWAWWSAKKSDGTRYDRDSQAGYVIHYSGGTATRTVDQDLTSGKWVRLGTFTFAAGISGYVDLTRDTANGVSTCADAVKFVKVG